MQASLCAYMYLELFAFESKCFCVSCCILGLAQTHAYQPPGPPAPAGCSADLPELPVQHQRGDHAPTTVHDCEEGRGECSEIYKHAMMEMSHTVGLVLYSTGMLFFKQKWIKYQGINLWFIKTYCISPFNKYDLTIFWICNFEPNSGTSVLLTKQQEIVLVCFQKANIKTSQV